VKSYHELEKSFPSLCKVPTDWLSVSTCSMYAASLD